MAWNPSWRADPQCSWRDEARNLMEGTTGSRDRVVGSFRKTLKEAEAHRRMNRGVKLAGTAVIRIPRGLAEETP